MDFISLALSYAILSGNLIADNIQSQYKNSLQQLQQDGVITPEQRIKLENNEKMNANDWKKDTYNSTSKKVWMLSCRYTKCFNKFNKDDKCKGNNLDLFASPKNESIVFSGNGKYSLSVFNSNQIVLGRTSRKQYSPYLDDIFSITKEKIIFDKRTSIISKTIHKSVYKDDGLLDKKVYGEDSYIVYGGKCNFRDNTDEDTVILPPSNH
jgi:hypothetical protein